MEPDRPTIIITVHHMIEQIAIARTDGVPFEDDPERFNRLALVALKPLARPRRWSMLRMQPSGSMNIGLSTVAGRLRKGMRAMIPAAIG